jgi:hypothetical protein
MATQDSVYNPIGLSEESHPLDVLPDGEPLLTRAKGLRKKGGNGWNKPENYITPMEARKRRNAGKNYGFALGHGTDELNLVAFDVETKGVLPEEAEALIDEHALLVWDSVHSGRNRLVRATDDAYTLLDSVTTAHNHLSDSADDDLEIQTSGHCIGPGCEIAHKYCNDTKDDCPGTGRDSYEPVEAKPVAPVVTKEVAEQILDKLGIDPQSGSGPSSTGSVGNPIQVPTYNQTDVAAAKAHLRTLQKNSVACFNCLDDRLNGGSGEKDGLRFDSGLIDRSATDFVTVSDLYGVMLVLGNEDEQRARELAYAYYTHRCEADQYMKSHGGRPRKWLSIGKSYRQNILQYAVNQFDRGQFQRWLNQRDTPTDVPWAGPMDGDYADTTRNFTQFALYLLAGVIPPDVGMIEYSAVDQFRLDVDGEAVVDALEAVRGGVAPPPRSKDRNPPSAGGERFQSQSEYPTKSEVTELARTIDQGRDNESKTYGNMLGRLKRKGSVKHAYCPTRPNGKRHVYYPSHLPDPEDARRVESGTSDEGAETNEDESAPKAPWD